MIVDYINIKIIDRFQNNRMMQVETTQIGAPKLTYNGADDKYQPIMAAEFSFNLTVTDRTDGKFFHLYTGNEKRYYVLVEDQSLNMLFEGYLLPDFYEEPYKNGVIFVNLVATDGIGLIKGQYLPNLYYKKETSVIKLIAECLRLTKLEKEICFAPAIVSAATSYRWDEIAVNGASYLESDDPIRYTGLFFANEVLPSPKNAYDILELLLKNIGCTLYGQADKWYIEGINRKHETSQLNEIYTFDGVYISNQTLTKNVVDVTFFANPTVKIISPWKRIDVSWDCDEDGDLIPDWAITENIDQPLLGNNVPDVFSFWKATGSLVVDVFSDQLTRIQQYFGTGTVTPGNFPYSFISGNKEPRNLQVNVLNSSGGSANTAQNPATLEVNYIDIKNKKYLKISDDYIDRKILIEYKFGSIARFIANNIDNAAILNVEEKDIANSFKNEFTIGTTILASSKVNDSSLACKKPFADKSDNSYNYPDDLQYLDYFDWQPYHAVADLKLENLNVPNNGFFNAKLHAPISPDYTQPWFYDYVVQELKVKISELKKWEDKLKRSIDFTTTYDLDIFHGDSIADLTEKQFRFRRPTVVVPSSDITINILSNETLSYLDVVIYNYYITYAQAQQIINNPGSVYVVFGGNQIFLNDILSFQGSWGVLSGSNGLYYVYIAAYLIDASVGIGSNVTDFQSMFISTGTNVTVSYQTENNEWRESWKRYGQTESIRYGIAIGKMYHDVQPGPLAVLEGTANTLVFPREIMQFQWMDVKQFIPTRMDIDFSQGRSNILMIESKHEIITDYVN